jgi:hypothetical protein
MKIFVISVMLMLYGCAAEQVEESTMQGLCSNNGHTCCPGSPIIIDLGGDGIALSSAADGVRWTLNPGELGQWAWTLPDTNDGFLVYDRNHNGVIEDGSEMFGNNTVQLANDAPNGFKALAFLDLPSQGGNGDGIIDLHDKAWFDLAVWLDVNHDGISQADELIPLDSVGIRSLNTVATASSAVDKYGNEFRFESTIVAAAPVGAVTRDVWLQQTPIQAVVSDVTEWHCIGWTYAVRSYTFTVHASCENAYVQSDPYATAGDGSLARLVVRDTSDTSESTAVFRLENNLAMILDGRDADGVACTNAPYPTVNPDYMPPPYSSAAVQFHVKCTSHVVVSNPPPTAPCFK